MKGKHFYLTTINVDGKDVAVVMLSGKVLYAGSQYDVGVFLDGMHAMASLHGSKVSDGYEVHTLIRTDVEEEDDKG